MKYPGYQLRGLPVVFENSEKKSFQFFMKYGFFYEDDTLLKLKPKTT